MEIPVFNANSVDPDRMLHIAASWSGPALFANYPFGGFQTKNGLNQKVMQKHSNWSTYLDWELHYNLFITRFVITLFWIKHGSKMDPKNV